ncbi:GDSL-type esterase/lipase family protein [Kribbella sp. NPDC056951]|uniref:GDSL-type esterase/lipase family protein n=1 Tax=Kribbella sp. NPDC056951 TaxID=3345978 RepID=UPI00362A5AFD
MRRFLAGLLMLPALLPLTAAAPQTATAAAPVKIMPLGSSTTAGSIPGGYRTDLYWMLTSSGQPVDFVGSITDATPANLPDRNHEGHGGWVIDQLTQVATERMQTYQPDTVLLHAGANDVLQNLNLATAPARLENLIRTLYAVRPDLAVYVSTVGPMTEAGANARAAAFNNQLPFVVGRLAAEGKKVHFVDSRGALAATDVMSDGIHLTHSGNTKLAAQWYAALQGSPIIRFEAETAVFAGKAHSAVTPSASNNGKAGWIDDATSSATVTVNAPYAGNFRVLIRGGNGTGGPCSHNLSVNGAAAVVVDYPSYGWEAWTQRALDVSLKAGANTFKFTFRTCFAELDSIDLVTA